MFTLHLHNQWAKDFPVGGWVRRLLLEPMDELLEEEKKKASGGWAGALIEGAEATQEEEVLMVEDA